MNPYGYPTGYDAYGNPIYPPPMAPGVVYPTTYVAPVGIVPPPVTYGVVPAPPVVVPQPMVPPGYPVAYGVPPPMPTSYNYPVGPQVPGINGYANRSISGHKFRSGFRVKHENYYPF